MISKGRKAYSRPTPFTRAYRFLQTVSTRHARDTKFHIDADYYWLQKGYNSRLFSYKRGRYYCTMYSNDVNSIIIVIIFNNEYYYSLSDINIFIHVIYCMLSIFNTNNVKENRNEDNFYLLHYKT